MGQRANLVIVENHDYKLYYGYYSATTLNTYLFWGKQKTLSFIHSRTPIYRTEWLNTSWCEGGILVDLDSKNVLFFGGEQITSDVQLRRVYLKLVEKMWPNYTLKWSQRGILALASYVKFNTEQLINTHQIKLEELHKQLLIPPEQELKHIKAVYSIKQDGKIKLIPSTFHAYEMFFYGTEIIDYLLAESPIIKEELDLSDYKLPCAGAHFDLDDQKLFIWSAAPMYVNPRHYQQVWQDWKIELGADDYSRQLEYCQGQLTFPKPTLEHLIERIREILFRWQTEPGNEELFEQRANEFLKHYQTIDQLFKE